MSKEHHDFLGTIPHGWEAKKLKELVEFKNGKAHEQCVDENGEYILVTSKFVSTEGDEYRRTNQALSMLNKNDIAFVMSDVPNGKALAKCFLVDVDNKYTLNQRICSLTTLSMNHQFLFYFLNRNKYYLKFDNGVGQTNLRKDEVLDCPVFVPPLKEQQKIAEILSSVDAAIEKTEQVIAKTEEVKKGLMQQLLTKGIGHTEFKDSAVGQIPAAWSVERLGNEAYIKARIGWKGLSSEEYTSEGPYLIAGKHILRTNILWDKCDHISIERYEESPEIMLQNKDVIMTKDGTIGRVAYIDNLKDKSTINGTMMLIRPLENFEGKFIYYYFQSMRFQKIIKEKVSGSSIPHIFQRDLVEFKIPVPLLNEQRKIVDILSNIDKKIEKEYQFLECINNLKKGLMQQLLTGQVRVKID